MPYNPNTKLLFVHIPKTAGTSISEYLEFKKGMEHCYFWDAKRERYPVSLHHMTPTQLAKYGLLTKRELFQSLSFTFVRNPFDRIVSEFHYRNSKLNSDANIVECFQEFLMKLRKYFLFRRWNIYDNHLRPQWHFLHYKNKNVLTHIFRFEQFESELNKIANITEKELGIKFDVSQLLHRRKSNRRPYQEYYNPKTRMLVENRYSKDLKTFDYSF